MIVRHIIIDNIKNKRLIESSIKNSPTFLFFNLKLHSCNTKLFIVKYNLKKWPFPSAKYDLKMLAKNFNLLFIRTLYQYFSFSKKVKRGIKCSIREPVSPRKSTSLRCFFILNTFRTYKVILDPKKPIAIYRVIQKSVKRENLSIHIRSPKKKNSTFQHL